jgi:arsenate reductase
MASVLFVCLHNAGRSQMSQALFERAVAGRHVSLSAGTTPAAYVHPEVIEVMRELGIDLSHRRPQLLTRELAEQADLIVTMGCGDACPYIPGKRYCDWDIPDPKGRPRDDVRAIRDDIRQRVASLAVELDGGPQPGARPLRTASQAAPLPMAPSCSLDEAGLRQQLERYRRAGEGARVIEQSRRRLVAELDERADGKLVEEAVAVERECCPFYSLDWEPLRRRLTVSVSHAEHEPALDAIVFALGLSP